MKMKKFLILVSAASSLALALNSVSCGGDDDDGKAGKVKTPAGEIALGKQLLGTWAPNKEGMVNMALESMKKGGQEPTPEQVTQLNAMIGEMAKAMVVEIKDGTTTMFNPEGTEESTYTIKSTDKEKSQLTIDIKEEGGDEFTGTVTILGKIMRMERSDKPGEVLVMDRIDAATFKTRKAAIEKMTGVPGLTPPNP